MKNTTYIEKCIELDAVTYILITTKGYFSLYDEKIAFCLKRGVLLSLKISDFDWKRVFFIVQNPRKGGLFQTWVRAWYTLWSKVGGGGGSLPPVIPHLSTSVGSCLPYMVFVVAKVIDLQVQLKTKKLKSWEDIFCFVFMCGQNRKIAEYHNTIM